MEIEGLTITVDGKEYKFKKPTIGLVWEVGDLDSEMADVIGKVESEVWDEEESKSVKRMVEPTMLKILFDRDLCSKFQPLWTRYCDLVFENPDDHIKDLSNMLEWEVEDIRKGFFDAASQMKQRLAALKSSQDSAPKAN
jgi:hypothetical protein